MAMAMNNLTQISERSSHICIITSQRKEYTLFLNNVTNLSAMRETGFNPWVGKIPLRREKATHSWILA